MSTGLVLKNSKIKLFREISGQDGSITKQYFPNNGISLRADIRQASSSEKYRLQAEQNASIFKVIVNYREGIEQDMLMEYKGKTYRLITPPSDLKGSKNELEFDVQEVTSL